MIQKNIVRVLVVLMVSAGLLVTRESRGADAALSVLTEDMFQQKNGIIWQMERSKKFKSAEDAETYINELNSGMYQDWRLPTPQELYKLFTHFDMKESGDVKIRLEGNYWLHDEAIHAGAWEIGDGCGPSRKYYTKKSGYVRAVRP
jgi:hypothetical protein